MQENDGHFDLNLRHSARPDAKTDYSILGQGNENGFNQFAKSFKSVGFSDWR
jgi:hypothetical protein